MSAAAPAPELSQEYLASLGASDASPSALVDAFSELEFTVQTFPVNAGTTPLLADYYCAYALALMLEGDLSETRFLLSRVPALVDTEAVLAPTVALLRALYTRTYSAVYATLDTGAWSSSAAIAALKTRFRGSFARSTFRLLEGAYTTIAPAAAATYLGLTGDSEEEVVRKLCAEGWKWEQGEGGAKEGVLVVVPKVGGDREGAEEGVGGREGGRGGDGRIGRLTGLVAGLSEV